MTHTPYHHRSAPGNRATRVSKRSRQGPTRFRGPWIEALEPRLVLDGAAVYGAVAPAWFAQVARAASEPVPAIYGPLTAAAGTGSGGWESSAEVAQWGVRLTETATEQAGSVPGVKTLLDSDSVALDVVRGLGLPGQVLLLGDRGNRPFVLVGPFNEHMLTEAALRGYAELKDQVAKWLTEQGIPHFVPPPLASDLYADASHPTAAGYAALARSLAGQRAFQDYCRR